MRGLLVNTKFLGTETSIVSKSASLHKFSESDTPAKIKVGISMTLSLR